ncbi:MAG: [FeFe] hydrogenase, group A, partial [Victivallaceae bacterium]|nr:[FeFe] hydrogenase, group A [Victivallaceae bacterium]
MSEEVKNTITVNNRVIEIAGERNLLEVIRKAGIDIPTFCYHSELSIYGACRLCLVEVEGKGIMASCSTAPVSGMVVHTDTKAIRAMRKINVELLLASHKRECPTCQRSATCTLQDLARKLGVKEVRYKQTQKNLPIDDSSPSLVRDPNKCVLCGDCVRVCSEVQSVGALDFAARGSNARVVPAFDQELAGVECVNCGQCAQVCPTGAIVAKSDADKVWSAIYDPEKTVVVQVAPAVRVALGERFGFPTGENMARKMVAALKLMGFDYVYDTCFSADMTIFEEATEFIGRLGGDGGALPMFTSCCPGWVKFVETFYPELLPNVSSTRSPQQIFGSVARKTLPSKLGVKPENLVVVSVMPCTAKKFEAQLPKFKVDGRPDVDFVVTTGELAAMIESMGIDVKNLEPEAFDMPLGFSTGGGVIFGATGGVMEAALRFAVEKVSGETLTNLDFRATRGLAPRKTAELEVAGKKLRIAIVHGLANARAIIEDMKAGRASYDFVEVMACPGGCVAGGGQPITHEEGFRTKRAAGLYDTDKSRQLQKPQDNYWVERCYEESFGGHPG